MATHSAFPAPAQREIHLIDVENLVGTPWFTAPTVARLRNAYESVSGASPYAQYVVGTSAGANLVEAGLGWGSCRLVFVRGQDGAELALLDAVSADAASRYARIVIGSGDHRFVSFAAALQACGVDVTVVSRRESLSRRLAFAVHDVRYLSAPRLDAAARSVGFGLAA